jgi:hypothetical protein
MKFDGNGCASGDIKIPLTTFNIGFRVKMPTKQNSVILALGNPGPAVAGQCDGTTTQPCNPVLIVYTNVSPTGKFFVGFTYNTKPGFASGKVYSDAIYDGAWHTISVSRASVDDFNFAFDGTTVKGIIQDSPDATMPPGELTIGCSKFDSGLGKLTGCVSNVSLNGVVIDTFRKEGTILDTC